ncbi:hypothetical protein [Actinomycetospora callitridis]|uniref:hypothetical protein n=1 Tax=Actinomycetospora callitridis TaxID=913944 RepID=UPI002367103C|nr:hypothetical protein [Actinomycetospora callitridis]MDD7916661.1 hypothetical protein [Actinomycetospora callitridis]
MSDTSRHETVATDDPPAGDGTPDEDADTPAGEADTTTGAEADTTADDEPAAVNDTDDTDDTDTPDDDDLTDEDDEDDEPAGRPMGLVIALGAVAAIAVVALAVTALLYPGFLVNPGSPDDRAAEITTALATKDGAALDAASCRTPSGQPLNPLTPDALTLIQSAVPAGPAQLMLDTQARAPIDLTLSAQGQTQTLPADLVLGVTDGEWCMTGLTQRQ